MTSRGDGALIGPLVGPLIGMVHLLPLPGSPRWDAGGGAGGAPGGGGGMARVLARARSDARALAEGGMDAVLVENFGDLPFLPGRVSAETCAAMTLAVAAVMEEVRQAGEAGEAAEAGGERHAPQGERRVAVGVNVLRNDVATALGVAAATGADFVRVNVHTGSMFTDQGLLEGQAHATLRTRATLAPGVRICADVHVKHATPPAGTSLEETARDTRDRGLADVLIVSGSGTGRPVDRDRLQRVRDAVPGAQLWVGSGVTPETVRSILDVADGVIVGSAIEEGGRAGSPVQRARVRALVEAARG